MRASVALPFAFSGRLKRYRKRVSSQQHRLGAARLDDTPNQPSRGHSATKLMAFSSYHKYLHHIHILHTQTAPGSHISYRIVSDEIEMAPSVPALRACLVDLAQPIQKRTRAAFYLRTDGGPEAVEAIGAALRNKEDSALLRHELAYVLGQIRDRRACPVLKAVLSDEGDDAMVRHEAAEALGAIGDAEAVGVLEKYAEDPVPEVADTCKLSLDLIRWSTTTARCVHACVRGVALLYKYTNTQTYGRLDPRG